MRKEDIKRSFDNIEPSESAAQRMLNRVLIHSEEGKRMNFIKALNFKRTVPALALAALMAVSLMTYNLRLRGADDLIVPGDRTGTDSGSGREDYAAALVNQFQIDNRHYIIMLDSQIAELKLPAAISQSDIGEKLVTIKTSVDSALIGSEVYRYIPAGGEAIVAVKKGDAFKLFKFLAFESYMKNQDEDTAEYLKLYGINSAADISKIQFIGYSDQAKIKGVLDIRGEITEPAKVQEFYDFYSVIENSSDKYFEKLFNFKTGAVQSAPSNTSPIPPDYKAQPADMPTREPAVSSSPQKPQYAQDLPLTTKPEVQPNSGSGTTFERKAPTEPSQGGGSSPGSPGSAGNALFDAVGIRIYNKSGIYLEAMYYPNIGFISRHEVSGEFAAFLRNYIH